MVRISSACKDARQREGESGRDASPPTGLLWAVCSVCGVPELGREVCGRHPRAPTSAGLSTAFGRRPGCVLGTGVHLAPTSAGPNCVQGEEQQGG